MVRTAKTMGKIGLTFIIKQIKYAERSTLWIYNMMDNYRIKFQLFTYFYMVCFPLQSQVNLKIPEKKSFLYDKSEISYYDYWMADLQRSNQIIKSKDSLIKELRFNDINNEYWNRFITYYKMIPSDPSDILYPFFDGIEFDKDSFCSSYRLILQDASRDIRTLGKRAIHYKNQLDIMDTVCDCVFKSYNPKLIKILNELYLSDQKLRNKYEILPIAQKKIDSTNLAIVLDLYDKYGYLNRKLVGIEYESYMFYIIQHSDLETMLRFQPIIHKEIEEGRLERKVYPLLDDRIKFLQNLPQEFGTQQLYDKKLGKYELYKSISKEKVNINRKKYGLPSI